MAALAPAPSLASALMRSNGTAVGWEAEAPTPQTSVARHSNSSPGLRSEYLDSMTDGTNSFLTDTCLAITNPQQYFMLRMASQPRCSCYVVGGGGASTREWTLGSAQRVFATDREQRTHVITQWYTSSSTRALVTSAES